MSINILEGGGGGVYYYNNKYVGLGSVGPGWVYTHAVAAKGGRQVYKDEKFDRTKNLIGAETIRNLARRHLALHALAYLATLQNKCTMRQAMAPRPPRRSVESGCHGVAMPSRPQCHGVAMPLQPTSSVQIIMVSNSDMLIDCNYVTIFQPLG